MPLASAAYAATGQPEAWTGASDPSVMTANGDTLTAPPMASYASDGAL
jgi:hypothetical protein